jgi:hypothetical protein
MGEWRESRGSRPAGLKDSDVMEFRRYGEVIGQYRVSEFNWDLWCDYRPAAQRDMQEAEG